MSHLHKIVGYHLAGGWQTILTFLFPTLELANLTK